MSTGNKPLAVFGGIRMVGWARFELYESLYFIKDQLVVARNTERKKESTADFSPEQVLNADKNNFAVPYSQIETVKIGKQLRTIQIKVDAGDKKYTWNVKSMAGNEFLGFDDVKRVLQPIFGWKLDAPDEF